MVDGVTSDETSARRHRGSANTPTRVLTELRGYDATEIDRLRADTIER